MDKKIKNILKSNLFLTFWLIFLNFCISVYPFRIQIEYKLAKIDKETIWEKENQSINQLKETITFFMFKPEKFIKNEFQINEHRKEVLNCKEENDFVLNYFFSIIQESQKNKQSIFYLQDKALRLLNECENSYIRENARNIIYWISLYEENSN